MAPRWYGVFMSLIFLLKVTAGADIPGSAFTQDNTALLFNLFQDYHKDVPPIETDGKPMILELSFDLISFQFINEATGLMSVNAWLTQGWTDLRLKWDPASYGNITVVYIDPRDLWQPDIVLHDGLKVDRVMENRVMLQNDGSIYSIQHYRVESKCDMNLGFFPYDEQKCRLKYGSWVHHGSIISLKLSGTWDHQKKVDFQLMHPSEDFVVVDASQEMFNHTYACCPMHFPEYIVTLKLKRSSGAYSAKLILPSVLSGLMVLATCLLPPASHEKITLCGITFLTLVVLLDYLQSIVPASGDTIIGEFLAFALCLDFFAAILAVVSYVLHGRGAHPMRSNVEGDNHDLKIQSPPITKTDWLRYLDVASFVIFSVVFVIGTAIMLGRRG